MTATPSHALRRVNDAQAAALVAELERDFGQPRPSRNTPSNPRANPGSAAVPNAYLLDALDRGEHDRFLVWPGEHPRATVYASPTGTLVPAGDPAAGAVLAEASERIGWRVLVGDARIGDILLNETATGVFRRRVRAREQRFMAVEAGDRARLDAPVPAGFRPARRADLEVLVELACRLHVEDLMGPPIARSARSGVRARMEETIERGATYVVERGGRAVGKADLSLRSRRRGAQIAGVYVDASARGRGIATGLVAELLRRVLDEGMPSASLHVRSDNAAGIIAYERAGLIDRGPWVLAVR